MKRIQTLPRNLFLSFLILFSLSACVAPTGTKFIKKAPVQKGYSNVYLYRPFNVMGGASPSVLHNGKEISNFLGNQTFIKYQIKPGQHTFETSLLLVRAIPVTIESKRAGETRYIRVEYKFGVPYAFKMVEAPEATALSELASCVNAQGN